ncbi:hypothetical protein [Paenibacillus dendritiformis]|uniref:hypothetical protein n=1 Tax=Paenibacillus dendritiformis TaxID=130049 RepID=UPI00387E05BC
MNRESLKNEIHEKCAKNNLYDYVLDVLQNKYNNMGLNSLSDEQLIEIHQIIMTQ